MDSVELLLVGLAGIAVFLVLASLVGRLFRGGCLSAIAPLALLVAVLVGGSLYLDANGAVAPAQVTDRREYVGLYFTGGTDRAYLVVRFQPQGAASSVVTSIAVDPSVYDQFAPGSDVRVRYLPAFPTIARLEQQSTLSMVTGLVSAVADSSTVLDVALALLSLGVIWLCAQLQRSRGFVPACVLAVAWAAVATLAVFAQANGTSGMPGPRLTTVANVRDVREFDYSARRRGGGINRSSNGLVQPFQLAWLEFTPTGFDHPVEAYDAVDAGSVPTLAKGNAVEVSYSTSNPRAVQIVGGTRRHRWLNGAFLFAEGPILFVVLTGAGGPISRLFAGRKAGPSRSARQG